ncbi:hypothetical protein GCM10023169_06790 [Georgenia halophila]|uniref:HTH luxR-type domain-containing protein n=1 Tax=Georgenia halophila TaxID=620889 RepID=A0ABP8KWY4_9MICO
MAVPARLVETNRAVGRGLPRVPAAFTPTPAAAQALRGLPSLVVVHAPRGYGKTATVSSWLRSTDLPNHDVVWISLTGTVGREQFWTDVLGALAQVDDDVVAGLHRGSGTPASANSPDDGPGRGSAALVRAVQGRRPLVLVIDGYDRVADADVDEELVELARRHEGLRLVLTTRSARPVVSLARAAAPEAVVLEASHLALAAELTHALADAMGVKISVDAAERVGSGLGGWPALVRVALATARPGPDGEVTLDPHGLADYLRFVLRDTDDGDLILTTAVAERFTPQLAEQLVGTARADLVNRALNRLTRVGLLRAQDGTLSYPPLLREALNMLLREDDPVRYRRLSAEVTRAALAGADGLDALEHALASQDADLLTQVVESSWACMLAAHDPRLHRAVADLPARAVATNATVFALHHVLPGQPPQWFLEALQSDLPATGPALGRLGDPDVNAALLELGHALLADGDLIRASFAWFEAARHPLGGPVAREATAGVALATALLGHLRTGERWLAEPAGRAAPGTGRVASVTGQEQMTQEPLGQLQTVAAAVVPALTSLDRLEDLGAAVNLPDVSEGLSWLQAVVVYNRANRALFLDGSPAAAAEVLGEIEQQLDRAGGQPRLGRNLLGACAVDLCLASGQLARAREVGERAGPKWWEDGLLRSAHARLALYSGDDRRVLLLTGDAFRLAPVRPRIALKLALARAVAAHRLDQRALSLEAAHLVVGLAERTGMIRPLVLVPRADLEQVIGEVPGAPALLERLDEAHAAAPFPQAARVERLSMRERAVLRELALERPLPVVARRLYVSESTVKTQVRSIYRKLGVHSRTEALERSRLLGLLP